MNTKQTKVEIVGTVHEIIMGYFDESISFDNFDTAKVVENLCDNPIYSEFLIDPEIFEDNDNYIVASNDRNKLDENVSKIENIIPLSSNVKNELKAVLDADLPRFPSNPEHRYISILAVSYPDIPITFEVNDSEFDNKKIVYSTSRLSTFSDTIFHTIDDYEFLNAAIYDGELVDMETGNQTKLGTVDFFIYDTKTKKQIAQRCSTIITV